MGTLAEGDPFEELHLELERLDVSDGPAVRALALKIEALGDYRRAHEVYRCSNALRSAAGRLRADALTTLLAREERDEFMRRAADPAYMAPVDLAALRVPRYMAVEAHNCPCGATLMVPYHRQGGPSFSFHCPACSAPYLAKATFRGSEYRLHVESDTRPPKKRKRRSGSVL